MALLKMFEKVNWSFWNLFLLCFLFIHVETAHLNVTRRSIYRPPAKNLMTRSDEITSTDDALK